jgi:membrane-bound lytic murein transglycosylase D
MLIKAGSVLLIPRHRADAPNVEGKIADTAHLALAPEIIMKRISVKAKKNETLADIARKSGSTLAAALELNNKLSASARLKPGQVIVLDIPVRANTRTAKATPAPHRKTITAARAPVRPTVLARR